MFDIGDSNDPCVCYVQNTTELLAQYYAHIPSTAIFILLNVFKSTPQLFKGVYTEH